jgi:hypothetical protein
MIDKEADLSQQKRTWVMGSRSLVEDCLFRPAPEETASAQAIGGREHQIVRDGSSSWFTQYAE